MVMLRAAESCPRELDSFPASVPNAKEVTKPKLCPGSQLHLPCLLRAEHKPPVL